jgi:hypothetical protein
MAPPTGWSNPIRVARREKLYRRETAEDRSRWASAQAECHNINQVAVEPIKELLQDYPDTAPLPIFVFDAGYELGQLASL